MNKTNVQGQGIIEVNNMSQFPANINIKGYDSQKTREGYNLVNPARKKISNSGLTLTINDDGSYTLNGTSTDSGAWLVSEDIDYQEGETYTMIINILGGTCTNTKYGWALLVYPYYSADNQAFIRENSAGRIIDQFTYSEGGTNKSIYWWFGEGGGATFTDFTFSIMVIKGNSTTVGDKPYEQFGVSPSIEYPSEIESLGNNVNIFDGATEDGGYNSTDGQEIIASNTIRNSNPINVKGLDTIMFSCDGEGIAVNVFEYDKNMRYLGYTYCAKDNGFVLKDNTCYVNFSRNNTINISKIQIQKGNFVTPYNTSGAQIITTNSNFLRKQENSTTEFNGVTVTSNNGVITINGTTQNATYVQIAGELIAGSYNTGLQFKRYVLPKGSYKFMARISGESSTTNISAWLRTSVGTSDFQQSILRLPGSSEKETEFEIAEDTEYVGYIWIESGATLTNFTLEFMLKRADDTSDFIQGQQEELILPIQEPMLDGDYFVKESDGWKEVHTFGYVNTREVENLSVSLNTSNGEFRRYNVYNLVTDRKSGEYLKILCTHFKRTDSRWHENEGICGWETGQGFCIGTFNKELDTADKMKTVLQQNNVEIYYPLAIPTKLVCTSEQSEILDQLQGTKLYSPTTYVISNANMELEYVSLDDEREGIMKPAWVEKNGEKVFPITHSRALLGGISSKAYNINDSVYGNNWNNITENGLYYDENGSNRPPVGVNTYPDNLLIEVKNIKDRYIVQEVSMFNTELFNISDRETVGYIRDRYGRKGSYNQDGSVTWSSWNAISTESDINRVYTEDKSSTTTDRKISMSDISSIDQLLNKVIYIKSISIGESGEATLNINEFGAKPLRTPGDGTFTSDLEENWIITDQIYSVSYDGNNFNIVGAGGSGGSSSGVVKSSDKSNIDWLTMTPEEFENAKVQGLLKDGTVYNVLDESVSASSSNPVGSVLIWFGLLNKIPANYVLCDGRLLNVAEYPVYADRYGNMYGGDGSKTVGVPNISGKVVVSLDSNQTEFNALGKTGGSKSVTLTEGQIPSHSHKVSGTAGAEGNKTMILTGTGVTGDEASISDTSSVGGGESHTNLQPYIVGYYIIKVRPEAYSEDVTNLDKKISILKTTGDGNKYLSDDGTYKEIPGVSGDYLPLSGGILTTNSYNGIELKRNSNNSGSSIKYSNMLGVLGKIGFTSSGSLVITNGTGADGTPNMLQIAKDGSIKIYNNLLPNANNSTSLGSSNNKFNSIYASNFIGNSSTATKLKTARTINGISFDGSEDISIPEDVLGIDVFYIDQMSDATDCTSQFSVENFNKIYNGFRNVELYRKSGVQTGSYYYWKIGSFLAYENSQYSNIKVLKMFYINNYTSPANIASKTFSLDTSSNKVYIGEDGPNSSGPVACFTENTKVYTSEGLVNISDIDIGSRVLSYNKDNELELKEVDKIVSHTVDKIYKINIDAEIIEATWSHPFYTENRGKVLAKDLRVGDVLKCYDNRLIEIKSIEIDETPEDVYEIRIKDNNNYFVGYNSILVYNEDSVLDN